ncbi:MAG: OB-fold-containig protein [Pseudomonadota bacterium]
MANGFFVFSLALAVLCGLLLLEIVFIALGGTILGGGEADFDAPEFGAPDTEFDVDLSGLDAEAVELDLADTPGAETAQGGHGSIAAWLGLGEVPAAIWLAATLMTFGLSGLTIQTFATGAFGGPLPTWLAAAAATLVAVLFSRRFARVFARLLPKTETQALSERHLGRRMGVITQGTAARGRPAEVRVTDRYGNVHYLRAEPLKDDEVIAQGTEVVVLRNRHGGGYSLVALTD